MIALRDVGIVLGLEVSRLARNSLDWYQLLELAAAFDVLIADEDGVYNPGDFNDRLLLGLKGLFRTFDETQESGMVSTMRTFTIIRLSRWEFHSSGAATAVI
jgi:hypothetical protein